MSQRVRRSPPWRALSPSVDTGSRAVTAFRRHGRLALIVFDGPRILEVRRHALHYKPHGKTHSQYMAQRIAQAAADYGVRRVVAEPSVEMHQGLCESGLELFFLTVGDAKKILWQTSDAGLSHEQLYERVLAHAPALSRFVSFTKTGGIQATNRWRTVVLLAAGFGLAAQHRLCNNISPQATPNQQPYDSKEENNEVRLGAAWQDGNSPNATDVSQDKGRETVQRPA